MIISKEKLGLIKTVFLLSLAKAGRYLVCSVAIALMISCGQQAVKPNIQSGIEDELLEPQRPNMVLHENMSLADSLLWANYQYELMLFENEKREQVFVAQRDAAAKKLKSAMSLRAIEEKKSANIESKYKGNQRELIKKSALLTAKINMLINNEHCFFSH